VAFAKILPSYQQNAAAVLMTPSLNHWCKKHVNIYNGSKITGNSSKYALQKGRGGRKGALSSPMLVYIAKTPLPA